jgi:hypothetical protein
MGMEGAKHRCMTAHTLGSYPRAFPYTPTHTCAGRCREITDHFTGTLQHFYTAFMTRDPLLVYTLRRRSAGAWATAVARRRGAARTAPSLTAPSVLRGDSVRLEAGMGCLRCGVIRGEL